MQSHKDEDEGDNEDENNDDDGDDDDDNDDDDDDDDDDEEDLLWRTSFFSRCGTQIMDDLPFGHKVKPIRECLKYRLKTNLFKQGYFMLVFSCL